MTATTPRTGTESDIDITQGVNPPDTTFNISVIGCVTLTVSATATGPGGTSARSAPASASACGHPGAVRNLTLTVVPGCCGLWDNRLTWDPPVVTGAGTIDYVVTVSYPDMGTCCPARDRTEVVTGTSYERAQAAGRDPYIRISVAARNSVGTGLPLVGYPRGG
jgi:hypothetical protein